MSFFLLSLVQVIDFSLWCKFMKTSEHIHAQTFSHLNIPYLCVAVMDSLAEEKKTGEEVSSAIGTMKAKHTEETNQHDGKRCRHTLS